DLVLNNLNKPAFIYQNNSDKIEDTSASNNHFLKIKLKGSPLNIGGIGAKIHLFYATDNGRSRQYYEHFPTRGYKSFVDQNVHFGLGPISQIDSLIIIW